MILLDADVLLIDVRYPNDTRFPVNRQFLARVRAGAVPAGMTVQAVLEVVGISSFNLTPARIGELPRHLLLQYGLMAFPDWQQHPDYAGCSVQDLVTQMSRQMSLGDAVQSLQIARFAVSADTLITWNAGHFTGKVAIPVCTPQDWLNQTQSLGP